MAITHQFSDKTNLRIGKAIVYISAALLIGTVVNVALKAQFLKTAYYTQGTVIKVQSGQPIVNFKTSSGTGVTFQSYVSSSSRPYYVGELVDVAYLANKPEDAVIAEKWIIWSGPIVAGVFAVMFLIIGYLTTIGKFVWGPLKQTRIMIE